MRFLREFEVRAKWEKKKGVRREAEGRDEGTQSFTAEENRGPWLK